MRNKAVMNEPRRLAYLRAMGIDSYVSRRQLPGAAPTRRLALVAGAAPAEQALETGGAAADQEEAAQAIAAVTGVDFSAVKPNAPAASETSPQVATPVATQPQPVERFSIAVLTIGKLMWLEDLDGRPLAREQVQLARAMAAALRVASGEAVSGGEAGLPAADISQFDWPMHNNTQLGLDPEAARASLAGFLGRRLEQQCQGLVLMGEACKQRLDLGQIDCDRVVSLPGTLEMMASPELKQQAWRSLASLLGE